MLNMLLNYTKLDIQYHNMPLMILIFVLYFSTFYTECTAGSFFQIFQYLNHPENRFSIGYISGIGIAIFFQNYIKLRNSCTTTHQICDSIFKNLNIGSQKLFKKT